LITEGVWAPGAILNAASAFSIVPRVICLLFLLLCAQWVRTHSAEAQQSPLSAIDDNSSEYQLKSDEWTASAPLSSEAIEMYNLGDRCPLQLSEAIPQIYKPVTGKSRLFNQAAEKFGQGLWTSEGGPQRSNPDLDGDADLSLDWSQDKDSLPPVLSINFVLSEYTRGAAHGDSGNYSFNW
jgi:hypothetical protein